ncbi:hypothetical protein AWC38_SpisGene2508 [Stylophora pistillata]|uniref:Integrase core domain-containing protein n=1 Tax=Stylophora pistillata TaxID=50429 RepID=A0A2B4SU64_STYPI|nr:hypothetical protein AWC38_SpisGene2508 [Stylophora pistillata]
MANRRRVLRERNESGFSSFLQNLKGILKIFLSSDIQITNEELVEVRQQLIEANGTLSLLQRDIERGDPNPTGLPGETLKEPLTNLSNDIGSIVLILRDATMQSNESNEDSYSAPFVPHVSGLGRKKYDITKEQLEHLRSLFFSWTQIANMLQVSISTIQRRRREFGLGDVFEGFSNITDDELDQIYLSITGNASEGPVTPNIGRRRFIGALRSRGLHVQRWRVTDCLHRLDPVDGKTRLLIYVCCCNNNKADTVLSLFEKGVEQWGLPSRVRSDYGMENYYVGQYMIQNRGESRGSIITGSSVHNSRVERTHRDIYSGVLAFYSRIFETMEEEGLLNILDDVHLFCLHYVYLARINKSLKEFVDQMNHHPVSTEKNQSPLQMWERGMLENMHSGHTALSPSEIDEFGLDPENGYLVEDEDYQVNIVPPSVNLSDGHLNCLPCPLQDDNNCGIDIYNHCVQFVYSLMSSSP